MSEIIKLNDDRQKLREIDGEVFNSVISIIKKLHHRTGELKPKMVISDLPKDSGIKELFILGHNNSKVSVLKGNVNTTLGYKEPASGKFITLEIATKGENLWMLRILSFPSPKKYKKRTEGKGGLYNEIYASLPPLPGENKDSYGANNREPENTKKVVEQLKKLDTSLGENSYDDIVQDTQKKIANI